MSADTLALWPDAFIVGDLFSKVVVWRGSSALPVDAPEEALARYMTSVKDRFPAPSAVIRCTDGSSMGRIIVSRLNPSHQDTLRDQCVSLPTLITELSPEQRDELCKKFPKTDTPSATQWLRRAMGTN